MIVRHVPQKLEAPLAALLAVTDLLAVAAAAYVSGLPLNAAPAAYLAIGSSLYVCGAYRVSYAVRAHDELYHAFVALCVAVLPVWVLLAWIGGLPWQHIAVLLLLALAGIGSTRTLLRAARQRAREGVEAECHALSAEARRRVARARFLISKRALDVALAAFGIAVFSPVMLATAVCVLADSGAPVLFRQERVGRNGSSFTMFKFRTMRDGAGSQWAKPGDARITRLGAFLRRMSLDELPQLFNVLRGEMSLVGPRPEMGTFADDFRRTIPHYDERHAVDPGLTGWAQVHLARNLDPSDMPRVLPYDLFYVEHASRVLDGILIVKTASEFLFHRAV